MMNLSETDLNEILLSAQCASESGFDRVSIQPEMAVTLVERLRGAESACRVFARMVSNDPSQTERDDLWHDLKIEQAKIAKRVEKVNQIDRGLADCRRQLDAKYPVCDGYLVGSGEPCFTAESVRQTKKEDEFKAAQANHFTYQFARPSVTVDCVVFSGAYVALIRRGKEPFRGCWALPGGFLEMNERIEDAARRELYEETNLVVHEVWPVGVFDEPKRDPRDRVIGHAFWTIIPLGSGERLKAGDDAAEAEWIPVAKLSEYALAFDHAEVIRRAIKLKDEMIHGVNVGKW